MKRAATAGNSAARKGHRRVRSDALPQRTSAVVAQEEEEEERSELLTEINKKQSVPPIDKSLLREALKYRGDVLHNYGHSSNAVARVCSSPRGARSKGREVKRLQQ